MPATPPVSRFDFARPHEVPTGRVALAGTPFDGKPCLIGHFPLRAGKTVMDAAEATITIRNPPPPGVIRHATLRGASSDTFLFFDVFESTAAVANALMRLQNSADAMMSLSAVVDAGGEAWVGPVCCIPGSIIPRAAVVRVLTRGADSITITPRHVATPVDCKTPLNTEVVFAPRYWRHASINWVTTAPFEAACTAVAHAYEVEPVRFEMGVVASAIPAEPSTTAPATDVKGGRGYGAQRYTYQHRPHDAPVRRPAATSAEEGNQSHAVWRIEDDEAGVRAAGAVLRTQGFRALGVREAQPPEAAGAVAAFEVFSETATAGGRDDGENTSDGRTSSSQPATAAGTTPQPPRSEQVVATSPPEEVRSPSASPPSQKPKSLPVLCAQVIEASGKRQRCYVDQRKVAAPEAGDVVVVAEPSSSKPDDTAGESAAPPPPACFVGRVVAVSRWSRRKAGTNGHQGHPRVLRRATMPDLAATLPPSAMQPVEAEAVPAVLRLLNGGGREIEEPRAEVSRLYVVRIHPDAPSCLVIAEVRSTVVGAAPAAIPMVDLRAAIAGATGAPERSVFRVVENL